MGTFQHLGMSFHDYPSFTHKNGMHRLQDRLLGSLIQFAPYPFVPQCQKEPSVLSSLLEFQLRSTHSIGPAIIPYTSTLL
jgi:hypothetical protein